MWLCSPHCSLFSGAHAKERAVVISIITFLYSHPTITMIPTFLSRLWSSPNLSPSSSPRPLLTVPSVDAYQQPHTILITMGRCNFTSKSGILCSCTSGSCTSEIDIKGREEHCEECGHKMTLHSDYSETTPQSNVSY